MLGPKLLQSAMTKYHNKVISTTKTCLGLTVLGAEKSKIRVSADLVSGESAFPGLHMAFYHLISSCHRGKERTSLLVPSDNGINLIMKTSSSCLLLNLIASQRP